MQLSVIIVNYNVKYFLEQCLCSVQKAIKDLQAEVMVVDNASTDGSNEYLPSKFPQVRFIRLSENLGFAKANNLALQQATGDFILFLNPDTIVAEDSFRQCISFFEQQYDAASVGVQMIDGSGTFLPESKRAFPSAAAAFFKLSGIATLFPHSPLFARYNLGHLSADAIHRVDVLSGAFMMVRKTILDITGGFDEAFFMYGEDIDLSYRLSKIKKNGIAYANYYLGTVCIIHFKGESTKRNSARYVQLFYKAMQQFVDKYPEEFYNGFFNIILTTGIAVRRFISSIKRLTPKASSKQKQNERLLIAAPVPLAEQLQKKLPGFTCTGVVQDLTSKLPAADALLLCNSEALSYQQIIEHTKRLGQTYHIYIHGEHSKSIAGSYSNKESGVTMELL